MSNAETQLKCKSFEELTTTELYAILKLRQEIFIVEQDCAYLDADSLDFESHHCFITNVHDEILSYARLIPEGISYKNYVSIGRVVTAKHARGEKMGRELMSFVIEKSKAIYSNIPIKLSAQVYILPFYNQLGFKEVGDAYLEDNIPHKAMVYSH